MQRYFAAMLCLLTAGAFGAKEASAPVGPDAVWQQGMQFLPRIHKACDQYSGPKFGECFAEQMAKHASPAAVAFTRAIHNEGWLRDFRKTGRVDIAYVEYPFRTNENQGCLLVNGSPAFLDVDDLKRLPREELKRGASLLPGDRSSRLYPLAILYPDGAQEFVVDYKGADQPAFFGFEFNPKGKFSYARYLGTETTSEDRAWPIQVRTGQRFTISLPSPSDWSLPQPGAGWIVRRVDDEKSWSFETVGAGTTKMTLRRGSDDLALKLVVAPGLRK